MFCYTLSSVKGAPIARATLEIRIPPINRALAIDTFFTNLVYLGTFHQVVGSA